MNTISKVNRLLGTSRITNLTRSNLDEVYRFISLLLEEIPQGLVVGKVIPFGGLNFKVTKLDPETEEVSIESNPIDKSRFNKIVGSREGNVGPTSRNKDEINYYSDLVNASVHNEKFDPDDFNISNERKVYLNRSALDTIKLNYNKKSNSPEVKRFYSLITNKNKPNSTSDKADPTTKSISEPKNSPSKASSTSTNKSTNSKDELDPNRYVAQKIFNYVMHGDSFDTRDYLTIPLKKRKEIESYCEHIIRKLLKSKKYTKKEKASIQSRYAKAINHSTKWYV